MTKRTRQGILYLLIVVFAFLGATSILYAQGWRVKLNPLAIGKIGAIYVKPIPSDAAVTLDDKPVRQIARIFERGTLVNNLFPGSYRISLAKEGYIPWTAEVPVAQSYVSSRAHIVLVPKTAEEATSGPVSAFLPLGQSDIALLLPNHTVLFHATPIPGDMILAASDDGRVLITKLLKDSSFFIATQGSATSTNINRTFPRFTAALRSATSLPQFISQSDTLFSIQSSSSLVLANTVTGKVTLLADTAKIGKVTSDPSRILWTAFDPVTKRSTLSLYDIPSDTLLPDIDQVAGKAIQIELLSRNTAILLQDDHALYSLSLDQGTRARLENNVVSFAVAPDKSAIALLTNSGVEILSQKNTSSYTFLAIPDTSTALRTAWYEDKNHLFLFYSDRAVFIDLGDATLQNRNTVATGTAFAYLPDNNELYVLQGGAVSKLQFP